MSKLKNIKWYWWVLIVAIPLMVIGAMIKAKNKPSGEPVTFELATKRNITEIVSASGKIFPETEIKISSDVSGEIVELYVNEGDSVRTGQILARVNADAYESAVDRSNAGVNVARTMAKASSNSIEGSRQLMAQAKLQFENAKKIHQRNKDLYKDGIIALADLEATETSMKNLELAFKNTETNLNNAIKNAESAGYQVKDAEAVLKEQRTNLGRTIIKSPANGIVSKLSVEKGERVVGTMQMSGTEMMRIADLDAMEVQVEVSENDIVHVAVGDKAEIEVDAYTNRKFKGNVTEVSNSASNISNLMGGANLSTDQVSKYIVKVRIDKNSYSDLNKGSRSPFRPGMSATVDIKTEKAEQVTSIPIQSVIAYDLNEEAIKKKEKSDKLNKAPGLPEDQKTGIQSDFREAVFVVKGDTVERRDVVTGIQDIEYIEIKSGLEEGETVVTGPYVALSRKLKSGKKVHEKKEEKGKEKDKEEDEE